MSAIDEIKANPHRYARAAVRGVEPSKIIPDLHQVAPLFWAWYHSQNPDRTIFKVYFFSVTIKMLKPVFVLLFGPEQ
jgi:hypothetical protein